MLLIPSITLKAGRVVGADGKPERKSPADIVARLTDSGVNRVQLVDNDSLDNEQPGALMLLEQLANRFDEVTIQVMTGVKDEEHVQAHLDAGVHWLVMGHRAASAPHVLKDLCLEFPGHILINMSVRDGRMASDAHSKLSNHDLADLAEHFQSDGVHGIIYQDVDADGNPAILNAETARAVSDSVSIDCFVAGKIDSMQALEAIRELADTGIAGAIVNGALGHDLDLDAALRLFEPVT